MKQPGRGRKPRGESRRGWAARQVALARERPPRPACPADGRPPVLELLALLDVDRMPEDRFQEMLRRWAEDAGWLYYHVRNSEGSNPGWPDTVLLDPRTFRLLIVELKAERGRVSDDQRAWLDCLAGATAPEVGLWRPRDLETIRAILEDPEGTRPGRRCPTCGGKGWVDDSPAHPA